MRLPSLVAQVNRALRAAGTPVRGETLLLGLSGGPDSVALLDALALLSRPRGFRLVAAHLDHQLRPDSAEDAAFCRSVCDQLGVAFRTGAADVRARAESERGGIEQAARHERYAFLRRAAAAEAAAAIAIAHTRDDQAETLLLRLLRGSGATGLGAMRLRSGDLVRPLLAVPRSLVLEHLRARGLSWREDPTNADTVHVRNRVRHELLPYLESRFNPGIRASLARTAGLLADEAAHLRAEAEDLLRRASRDDDGRVVVARTAIAGAPAALGREVIRRAAAHAGGLRRLGAVHVEQALRLARSASAGRLLALPGGLEVRLTREEISIGRALTARKAVSSRAKR